MSRAGSDTLEEIRRLYFAATPGTIQRDFERAIDLLKSMRDQKERERASVYMEGLAELRKEFRPKKRLPRR